MGRPRRPPEETAALVAARLAQGLQRGMTMVDAWRAARAAAPTGPGRELEIAHHRAAVEHQSAVRRYQRRLSALRARINTGIVGASTGAVVFAGSVPAGTTWWGWAGLGAGAAAGMSGLSARRQLGEARPPSAPMVPLPPPPALPPGARGAEESAKLAALRVQLAGVLPAVARLHPGAGRELFAADSEAAPALAALVERLDVLNRLEHGMPGTTAAQAAADAAEEVRARLAAGITTYEQLLAAAARLLAAPDLSRGADEVLGPAVDALQAYAGGLTSTARVYGEGPWGGAGAG